MKLYADRPWRLVNQLLGDVLVVVAVYLAIRLGLAAHDKVAALAGPGRDAEGQARRVRRTMRGAAGDVHDTPVVGGTIAKPFQALASTSRHLAETAQAYQDAVERLAVLTAIVAAGLPIAIVLVIWLPRRIGWVVEASAARRLMSAGPGATELLAVRALARQPLRRLSALGPDVVAGWKAGDASATRALAGLELDELGLRGG